MAEHAIELEQQQQQAEQAVQDLAILFPEQQVFVAGEQLNIREYGFVEWLKLRQQYAGFVQKFTELMSQHDEVLVDDVLAFFEDEFADLQGLLCASIDKPLEFLDQLSAGEMESLMLTWWTVNKHFFLKSVVRAMRKNLDKA